MIADESQPSPADSGGKWAVPGVCILLALAVLLVFGRAVRYDFVSFDDGAYFLSNPQVKAGLTWPGVTWAFRIGGASNCHPLTWLSLMLDAQLFGTGPAGPHLTNIILHAINAVLLFLLLKRLTGVLWPGAWVAAVFAIHPLRVESVVWISERKDVLSGLFFMLTLWAYAQYVSCAGRRVSGERQTSNIEHRTPNAEREPSRNTQHALRYYLLCLFLFALGLMSKPMLVTVPFILLLLDWWPLNRLNSAAAFRLLLEKTPFFLLSAAACVATVFAQQGSVTPVELLPFSIRIVNALVSYSVYLGQMFYPVRLAVFYPYPRVAPPLWKFVLLLVLLAGISAVVVVLRKKRRYLLTGWLWYLGMLVPVIGMVQVGAQVRADRYTYLPQIGLYLIVAFTIKDLTIPRRYRRLMLGVTAAIVIAALMVCASIQTSYWRNSVSLWKHAVDCTSPNPIALVNLDAALGDALAPEKGIRDCRRAIETMPFYDKAYYNLGTLLFKLNRFNEAIANLQRAIEIKPDYAEAHYNLGNVLVAQGRTAEAMDQYLKAIQINPDFPDACYYLAYANASEGRHSEAIRYYEQAIRFKPDYAEAHNNLANLLVEQNQSDEAIKQYYEAIRSKPDYLEAHYNLAVLLGMKGRLDEAAEQFRKCIELNPGHANARGNLANLLVTQGKFDEAIKEYQRTLELIPNSAQAHSRLGQALQAQRRFRAAIAEYQKALDLDPRHVPALNNQAWVLATCPDATLRNGSKAVELARQAEQLSGGTASEILDTLAAAYAEAGRFSEAVETARRALNLPTIQNNQPLVEAIQTRLALYETNSPFHEKP